VVNQAMLCGCPVLVTWGAERVCVSLQCRRLAGSNSKRGACADHLRALGDAARRRMQSWALSDNINAVARAVAMACALKEDAGQENL
jgi:hypothetical protein